MPTDWRKDYYGFLVCAACNVRRKVIRSVFLARKRVCAVCHGRRVKARELAEYARFWRRHSNSAGIAPSPTEDPTRERRLAAYEARAAANLPLFRADDPWRREEAT